MPRRSTAWLAEHRVVVQRSMTGTMTLQIATNKDWNPDYETDYPGGVHDLAPEIKEAGRALALALHREIGGALSLRAWVLREEAKRGGDGKGLARLAADLLGLRTVPKKAPKVAYKDQSPQWKAHAAELRKLQEYKQLGLDGKPKYKTASGDRRARIAGLRGAELGNPFRPVLPLVAILPFYVLALGARADWQISGDYFPYTHKNCLPQDPPSLAHDVLARGGANLFDTLLEILTDEIGQPVYVDYDDHAGHIYSLQVQATPRAGRARVLEGVTPKPAPKGRKRKPGGGRRFVL